MEVNIDKFLFYNNFGRLLPNLDEFINESKAGLYYLGIVPELEDFEVNKIERFIKEKTTIDLECDMYNVVSQEISLNIIQIQSQDQLKRYLRYLEKEVKLTIELIQYDTQIEYYRSGKINFNETKSTEKENIDTRAYTDSISTFLWTIDGIMDQFEQLLDFVKEMCVENGFEISGLVISDLIFRGLPSDFIELLSALHANGSIKHKSGRLLRKNELIRQFRRFLNLENEPGFDDQNLSKRFTERKKAQRRSYLDELKKSIRDNE